MAYENLPWPIKTLGCGKSFVDHGRFSVTCIMWPDHVTENLNKSAQAYKNPLRPTNSNSINSNSNLIKSSLESKVTTEAEVKPRHPVPRKFRVHHGFATSKWKEEFLKHDIFFPVALVMRYGSFTRNTRTSLSLYTISVRFKLSNIEIT